MNAPTIAKVLLVASFFFSLLLHSFSLYAMIRQFAINFIIIMFIWILCVQIVNMVNKEDVETTSKLMRSSFSFLLFFYLFRNFVIPFSCSQSALQLPTGKKKMNRNRNAFGYLGMSVYMCVLATCNCALQRIYLYQFWFSMK